MQLFTQQRPETDFKHVKNPKDDFIESDFKSCKKIWLFYSKVVLQWDEWEITLS